MGEPILRGSWSLDLDPVNDFSFWEGAFSEEDCKEVIKHSKKFPMEKGNVKGADGEKEKQYSPEIRDCNLTFINYRGIEWFYERLSAIIKESNDRYYNFDLWGFAEGLQFTEYNAPTGKYDPHVDKMMGGIIRKLSVVVQLTDPAEYEGGELMIHLSDKPLPVRRQLGLVSIFPSYILHSVTPVTKGTRHSLVGWVTGKPFK